MLTLNLYRYSVLNVLLYTISYGNVHIKGARYAHTYNRKLHVTYDIGICIGFNPEVVDYLCGQKRAWNGLVLNQHRCPILIAYQVEFLYSSFYVMPAYKLDLLF